jgi:hypothetical protein
MKQAIAIHPRPEEKILWIYDFLYVYITYEQATERNRKSFFEHKFALGAKEELVLNSEKYSKHFTYTLVQVVQVNITTAS